MEDRKMTVKEFLNKFGAGEFENPSVDVQIDAGWYDWFCKDSTLARRTATLAPRVMALANSGIFDPNTHYVWFKNCAPFIGGTYDVIGISEIERHNDKWHVCVLQVSFEKSGCEVWSELNDFQDPILVGSWRDVKKEVLSGELKNRIQPLIDAPLSNVV